ncbi:HEAT repeat domain-containing protein [Nocardia sp. NPDC050718]|uniref:HEAT repeat domain-containing protein n=1 Tax=Nocardia sp. NPDC050718 TaxID=3155788 RepID=UPI0033C2682E
MYSGNIDKDLNSSDPDVRVEALIELIKRDDRTYARTVIDLFSEPDEAVRSEAVRAAGYLGRDTPDTVGPYLVTMLSDSDEMVRSQAADALGLVVFPPAAAPLSERLKSDPSWIVRAAAAESLGNYGGGGLIELMNRALDDTEYLAVQRYAIESLGKSNGYLPRAEMERLVTELGNDPELGVQVRVAAYRFGIEEQLESLKLLAPVIDEPQTDFLMNDFWDMLGSPRPPSLFNDTKTISQILDIVVVRWPVWTSRAEEIRRVVRRSSPPNGD